VENRWRAAPSESQRSLVVFVQDESGIWWCKSERARTDGSEVHLTLPWYDRVGRDVQVLFSVGRGGRASRVTLRSPNDLPVMPSVTQLATSFITQLVRVQGDRDVGCSVLFIVASEVKVGRTGLWRVRSPISERIPEPYRTVLTRSRTGRLAAF